MTNNNKAVDLPDTAAIRDFVKNAEQQEQRSQLSGELLRQFRSRLVLDFFQVRQYAGSLLSSHLVEIYNKSGNKFSVKNMQQIAELLKNTPDQQHTAVEAAKLFQASEFSGEMRVNRQHYDRNANGAMLYQLMLMLSQQANSKMDYPVIQNGLHFLEDGSMVAFDFGAAVSVRHGGDMVLHLDEKRVNFLNGLLHCSSVD